MAIFRGVRSSSYGIFSSNSNFLFINVVRYPLWSRVTLNSSSQTC